MSSSPIERAGIKSALFAPAERGDATADSHRRWFKRILPRSLYGRSLLILILPLVLAQLIATWIFYHRHWETVARRLSAGVAGDIAMIVESLPYAESEEERQQLFNRATRTTELYYGFQPGEKLPKGMRHSDNGPVEDELAVALAERVNRPFLIDADFDPRDFVISIEVPGGVLQVAAPRERLFTSTTYIFVLWMAGSSLVLLAVASLFMRNQVKSLRRLAAAAEAFGKGRDVANFKLAGASEVRQVGAAFLRMRERIQRQITQRTEMLAGVSHDLRTPLTRMRLAVELMDEDASAAELKADIAVMQRMVQGYLDFARGEGTEEPRETDLALLIEELVAAARRDGANIYAALPEDCVLILRPDAMRRCLDNLIGNARRYG
ncbi:MAG TPA: histidine kinase dimerization/phospho-acceptor domain-containing protein, partial [Stellaceae bacterium]|nr:histidine kinase dimerization/phospho-acceptor domain-containing protein [Stellaceae bacterium]